MTMATVLAVAAGGAMGAVLRYAITTGVHGAVGGAFPFGTLAVNVVGSCVLGAIMEGATTSFAVSAEVRALLITGFLGAFTTFSAFALDAAGLFGRGVPLLGIAYVVLSVALSIGGFYGGSWAVRSLGA